MGQLPLYERAGARGVVRSADSGKALLEPYTDIARKPYMWYSSRMTFQKRTNFEWDSEKDQSNRNKHGVSFVLAQYAFADPNRVILEDVTHSTEDEKRYYCLGRVGRGILTVRFTYREHCIRIFGAGYWRKGRRIYEERNQI